MLCSDSAQAEHGGNGKGDQSEDVGLRVMPGIESTLSPPSPSNAPKEG